MDAGMGIVVAEAEGELEEVPPHAGEAQGRRVEVNPFWSQRARDEAALKASRPSGLPPVPGTDEKLAEEEDLQEGLGPDGGLLGWGDRQNGEHPEAVSSRGNEEFWSDVKRDLLADLEGASVAPGGGVPRPDDVREPGLDDRDRRPGGGRGNEGGGLPHGNDGGLRRGEDDRLGESRGEPSRGVEGYGSMRGRPMGREGDLRGPRMVDARALWRGAERDGQGDQQARRPGDEHGGRRDQQERRLGGERDGQGDRQAGQPGEGQGERPVPRPSDGRRLQQVPEHRQDQVGRGREQREVEDGWDAAVRRSGILGGGQEQAGAAGSSGEEARRWTWGGRGLDLDWAWNDELKVWIPEKAQRPNDEEELIGEMDLFEDMERNYGRACKKLVGMEKQRKHLFGVIKELRGEVRKAQEKAQFWKEQYEQAVQDQHVEPERFETPVEEMFVTPMAQAIIPRMVAPVPPPPPPPPGPVEVLAARTASTPRARTRSPAWRCTPGGTQVPEGEPPRTEEADSGWEARWDQQPRGGWYRNWSGVWGSWDDWDQNTKAEAKPMDQIETGGAGAKVELPELAYDHSPLTLGDWFAVVGPQMQDLSQGAAEWWMGTMEEAKKLYEVWLRSTPLDRLKITVGIPEALRTARFVRTEQRGVTMLLRAIPEEIRKELISARDIISTGVLYRLLVTYQPGGPGERSLILRKLTDLGQMRTVAEAAVALREWRRYYLRAQEIGASLPDPTLLAAALEKVTQLVNRGGPQAFRVAQARTQLGLDTTPTVQGIWNYSELLLAEMDTARLMAVEPGRVKAMATGTIADRPAPDHAKRRWAQQCAGTLGRSMDVAWEKGASGITTGRQSEIGTHGAGSVGRSSTDDRIVR